MPVWVWRVLKAARGSLGRRSGPRSFGCPRWGRKYWNRLTPAERRELLALMIESKGRRSNLTKKEQDRVLTLLDKIRRERS